MQPSAIRDWTVRGMGGAQAAIPTFSLLLGHTVLLLRVGLQQPMESNLALPSPAPHQAGCQWVLQSGFLALCIHWLTLPGFAPLLHIVWHKAEIPLSITSLRDTESNKMLLSTSGTFVIMDCFGLLHVCNPMLLLFTCYRSLCLN